VNIVLIGFGMVHPGVAGAIAIMVTSFFMSIMFPTIFALGVKGLGANTKLGGALIVMSIVGGAAFPPLLGAIARSTGSVARGYIVVAVAYLAVVVYGFAQGRDVSLASVDRVPEAF
jgi:FHS family L-fucose permease-like MFS transporter